jgi:hypothetical protein
MWLSEDLERTLDEEVRDTKRKAGGSQKGK